MAVSIVATGACGALVLPQLVSAAQHLLHSAQARARFLGDDGKHPVLISDFLRNGVRLLRWLSRLLVGNCRLRAFFEVSASALRTCAYVTGERQVCELYCLGSLTVFSVAWLLSGNPVLGLSLAIALVFLTHTRATRVLRSWAERLREQIPDALRSLGLCFSAGYSLQQALEQTAAETPDPLGAELGQAVCDVAAGRSITEALDALEKRTSARDLRFALVALEVQHRTGGSLKELLENAAAAVVASGDLHRQLAVQTAQARLSARIVSVMPLILVGLLSVVMEGYLQTFFSSSAGFMLLTIALGMEALGVFAIRRILNIDLD
jgi:tight adherence protein B